MEPLLETGNIPARRIVCREFLFPRLATLRVGIELREVLDWLRKKGCEWSPTVATKVARGLLAALRDFGILEGRAQKRVADLHP